MKFGFVKNWPWWKDALMLAGLAALTVLVVLLAGCSTTSSSWVNPQKPDAVFYMDEGQCQAQALAAPVAAYSQGAVFDACMRGKGWLQQSTVWTGKPASSFSNDDFQCAGGTDSPSRGPKWRQCLLERGWTTK